MRLIGRLGEPRHRVVVVVGLLDLAIGCRDLAHQGDARGEDRGAFKLHLHALRVHHALASTTRSTRGIRTCPCLSTSTSTTAAT